MTVTSYDSYLVMSSFVSVYKSCDKLFQRLYQSADIWGSDLMTGLDKVFNNGKRANSPMDAAFMLHQVAFVLKHTGDVMQKEAGLFKDRDLSEYSAQIMNIQAHEVSPNIMLFLDSASQAYKVQDFTSFGMYLGSIVQQLKAEKALIPQ